jgi:hypothetical protein
MTPRILYIVGRPSRYDCANQRLLAGPALDFVHDALSFFGDRSAYELHTTQPKTFSADLIRVRPTHIIATGADATPCVARDLKFAEQRGYVRDFCGVKAVLTFQAQDCIDDYNKDADAFDAGDDSEDDTADGNAKDHAITSWKNYRFWFHLDVQKLFMTPAQLPRMNMVVCTDRMMVDALRKAPDGCYLYFDIESHPPTNTVQCFSIKWPGSPTYSYITYRPNGAANGNNALVFATLARTLRRVCVVIHNAGFDLPFMAFYHGFPFGNNVHDTMDMWHRLFPEAEKSLGHVISALLNEPFHKGTATFTPHNAHQQLQLLTYNARDVHTLEGIHRRLLEIAAADPAMLASFTQVNSSIAPYIRAELRGFELNYEKLTAHRDALRARIEQLTRVFRALVGIPDINPNSRDQLAAWLIDSLGYKVIDKTESGEPAMDAKSLYQYRLAYPNNVALTVLLAIRKVTKQNSMLGFEPFNHLEKR